MLNLKVFLCICFQRYEKFIKYDVDFWTRHLNHGSYTKTHDSMTVESYLVTNPETYMLYMSMLDQNWFLISKLHVDTMKTLFSMYTTLFEKLLIMKTP
ncbi:hypothetical protein AVEN_256662-1 [Araneus ventricosus]|uniref:Uncharacterized protein n=1 Tax=Araneus ventricosus TaxID=182803 RepID=A0A4Y2RKF8_ARAVE|nr:hypothetical protein AVEN_256662-1 [Araneus ventricosus]